MRRLGFALSLLFLLAFPAFADEGHHHEDLTADQLGTVQFPVSCAPAVQRPFERGIALLHSFWYEEAEKEFQQIAKDDPSCAMAHWGVATSLWHQLWNFPDAATMKRGNDEVKLAKSLHAKTDRERDYIAAMGAMYGGKGDRDAKAEAYSKAMEHVYRTYPDDREGAAFYALSLLAAASESDTTFADHKKAAAVLEKLFAEEPNHPGVAHYLIHSYDKPQLAQLGLPAARRYAEIAPAAPHALHMPSHIFARLGLWQDDIQSNLASIAATRKTAAMHMGGAGHQFHAMDFLQYAYLQSGHEVEAQQLVDEVKAMPAMKDMYGEGYDPRFSFLALTEARSAIELHRWTEAAALQLIAGAETGDNSSTYWARAIGAAHTGNLTQAHADIQQIEAIHKTLVKEKKKGPAEAVEQDRKEAQAWIDHADGKDDQAIAALRTIADEEESIGESPDGGVPAREMLAEILLEMKRPEQALAEYETDLKFYPNRFNGLYGAAQAAEAAGNTEKANTYYAQVVKNCEGSKSDRAELLKARNRQSATAALGN